MKEQMHLVLQIIEPWDLGEVVFEVAVTDDDLAGAAFPADSVLVRACGDLELGGRAVSLMELRPRHLESTLSMLLSGAKISVNGNVLDPKPAEQIWFIADAQRASSRTE